MASSVNQWKLGMQNGTFFAAHIPEEFASDAAQIRTAIDQAISEADANGVSKSGSDVTPWLLARVTELTQGVSLRASTPLLIPEYQTAADVLI